MGVYMTKILWVILLMIAPTMTNATSRRRNLEVQNLLKRLNKSPVKSIKSPDGDIIDCVHIHNQPAFDHPLLKNHTIQMRPSSFPNGDPKKLKDERSYRSIEQLWHLNGRCPKGTIPIRRVTKEDILGASSIRRFGMKKHGTIPTSSTHGVNVQNTAHEYATASAKRDVYYGAKGIISIWKPILQNPREFSLSQFWLLGNDLYNVSTINTIEVGWQVYPYLYKDNNTRLFIYWTGDSYQSTGCYNLLCSGFVQTNKKVVLGGTLSPVSSYGGDKYELALLVWMDKKTGNWWLAYGDNNKLVGYWPSSLFDYLKYNANEVQWGGEIVNLGIDGEHTTTQMGSGHFAEEGLGQASYIRHVKTVDNTNHLVQAKGISTTTTRFPCYNIESYENGDEEWGAFIYYGGPGRNPICP